MEMESIVDYIYFNAITEIGNSFSNPLNLAWFNSNSFLCKNCTIRTLSLSNSKSINLDEKFISDLDRMKSFYDPLFVRNEEPRQCTKSQIKDRTRISILKFSVKKLLTFINKKLFHNQNNESLYYNKCKAKTTSDIGYPINYTAFEPYLNTERSNNIVMNSISRFLISDYSKTTDSRNLIPTILDSTGTISKFQDETDNNIDYSKSICTLDQWFTLLKEKLNTESNKNIRQNDVSLTNNQKVLFQSKNNNADEWISNIDFTTNLRQMQFKNEILEELSVLKEQFIEMKKENEKLLNFNEKYICQETLSELKKEFNDFKKQNETLMNSDMKVIGPEMSATDITSIFHERTKIEKSLSMDSNLQFVTPKTGFLKAEPKNVCEKWKSKTIPLISDSNDTYDFVSDLDQISDDVNSYDISKTWEIGYKNATMSQQLLSKNTESENENTATFKNSTRTFRRNFVQSIIKEKKDEIRTDNCNTKNIALNGSKLIQMGHKSTCDTIGSSSKIFSIKYRKQRLPFRSSDVNEGDIVRFTRNSDRLCLGLVRFVGELPNQKDIFLGLELERNDGLHDGIYCGKRYFTCKERHGIFVSFQRVMMIFK